MAIAYVGGLRIDEIPLFARLPRDCWRALTYHLSICSFGVGDRILEEGEGNPGRFYVVLDGEAALCNKSVSPDNDRPTDYEIGVRRKHEVFGAISFLDGQAFSSSLIAKTPLTLAMLDFSSSNFSRSSKKLYASIIAELRGQLATDLRGSIADRLHSLQHEAEFSRYKAAVGGIVVTTLSLLSFYTLLLSALPKFELVLAVNFAISPFIILLFGIAIGPVILRSGFPPAFFGLQTANWRNAVEFAIIASLAFIALGAGMKWLLISTAPSFSHLSVFGVSDVRVNMHEVMMSPLYWVAVGLYLVLTPMQEFVARCCLQAPLHAFLVGSEFRRRL
jgi:CRP-like cAMP-binding protein